MNRPRRTTRFPRWAAALLCVAAFAFPAIAQSNKGTIVGTVTDPNGAVVKGAKVTATNVATNKSSEATTGDEGTYTIPALDPGVYKVTVDAQGFNQGVVDQVKLDTSSRQAVDVTLTTGAVSGGTVTVTGEAPLAETESSVRGDLITGKQVTDLPIPQRNFTLLATLSPGVTRPFVSTIGGGGNFEGGGTPANTGNAGSTESTRFRESGGSVLVVNGARPTNNNFTLDGVDNNEGQFGQIAIYPPPDAIAEFKIETSVAPAEGGRAGGGIISTTTRSGGSAASDATFAPRSTQSRAPSTAIAPSPRRASWCGSPPRSRRSRCPRQASNTASMPPSCTAAKRHAPPEKAGWRK